MNNEQEEMLSECPGCGKQFKAIEKRVIHAECPKCGTRFEIKPGRGNPMLEDYFLQGKDYCD